MKVVTWNIRLGIQTELAEIIEFISDLNPDILLLQEVGRNWSMGATGDIPARIAQGCGFPYVDFATSIDLQNRLHRSLLPISLQGNTGEYGHAVFIGAGIEAARRDLLELPRLNDEPRTLLLTELKRGREEPITLLSTHLSHVSDRGLQGEFLQEKVKELGQQRLILGGDLNEELADGSPWFSKLVGQLQVAPPNIATFPSDSPERAIDHLMTNIGPWQEVQVIDCQGRSDHQVVVAHLE